MKIKPILFNAEMVQALLEGRKTQTVRPIKAGAKHMQKSGAKVIAHRDPGDPWYKDCVWSMRQGGGSWGDYTHERFMQFAPYQKGDLLYVRETWRPLRGYSDWDLRIKYCADNEEVHLSDGELSDRGGVGDWRFPKAALTGKGKVPSLHMPRWASRITLEVTGLRAVRLQDITEQDAIAGGIAVDENNHVIREDGINWGAAQDRFVCIWQDIYGHDPARGYTANPCVWVCEFRVIHQNVDAYVESLKAGAAE